MAREQGTFIQSVNYELQKEGTIDARQLVDVFADLLNFDASNYITKGFPVTVKEDSTFEGTIYKKGWYQFIGGALDDANNWEFMGGSEIPAPIDLSTGLEAIDEGNGIGWRLKGRNPDNYGNRGLNSIDFSESDEPSEIIGATGERAVVFGLNNIVPAKDAIVGGTENNVHEQHEASLVVGHGNALTGDGSTGGWNVVLASYSEVRGQCSTTFGLSNKNRGHSSGHNCTLVSGRSNESNVKYGIVAGSGLRGNSMSTAVFGQANDRTYSDGVIPNNPLSPMLVIGNGNVANDMAATTRSDALVVLKRGDVIAPSLTVDLIDSGEDRVLVTKEWVASQNNFTTDESLYLDPLTNELRANVSDFSEKYTYTSGDQEFVLTNTPTKIIFISVNGQLLEDPLTQWSIDVPTKTITILDEMDTGDRVTVHYQYFITI